MDARKHFFHIKYLIFANDINLISSLYNHDSYTGLSCLHFPTNLLK